MLPPTLFLAANLLAPGDHGAVMGDGLRLVPDSAPSAALNNVCAGNDTLRGIDVSYYQGTINWAAVAGDGVDFALIRVSHSLQFFDPEFDANWAAARAAGVHAGVYQYFEPDEDPIAQADLLLDHMGPLMPGDLPPVIDVESTAGQSGAQIEAAVKAWVEHVEAELGVRPIIYTGPYFWQDNVGSNAFGDYPLWIAHYGTQCPLTPTPWVSWTFHQFTDSGSTAGIAGNVDTNTFNGTLDDLLALGSDEVQICGVIGPDGGTIDNGEDCYQLYGNSMFWREEAAGVGGSLLWTNATDFADPSNYAVWRLWFEEAGDYEVEVHIEPGYAESAQAKYQVAHAGGTADVDVDQTAQTGWISLGTYGFDAMVDHRVRLDDNTGEPNASELALVFDALRVTRIVEGGQDTGGGETGIDPDGAADTAADDGTGAGTSEGMVGSEGDDGSGTGYDPALPSATGGDDGGCGCRADRSPAPWAVLLFLPVFARRRRRTLATR